MMRNIFMLVLAALVLVGAVYAADVFVLDDHRSSPADIPVTQQVDDHSVIMHSRQFLPQRGIDGQLHNRIQDSTTVTHVLIQLDEIPDAQVKQELREQGIELLAYIPTHAWLAAVAPDADFGDVVSIVELHPDDKISPAVASQRYVTKDDRVNIILHLFSDVSLEETLPQLQAIGSVDETLPFINAVQMSTSEDDIVTLAALDSVQWIDVADKQNVEHNDGSRANTRVDQAQVSPYSLSGSGVAAAEWDSGWADILHDDFVGRITRGDFGSCGGGDSGTCGTTSHSTHVAGTMLGSGTLSGSNGGSPLQWRGMAPSADLISYEWWDTSTELNSEYNAAINTHNASISQNSWGYTYIGCGSDCSGGYDSFSSELDGIVRGSKGAMINQVWSAGNNRPSDCDSGVFDCISLPAAAKNIITAGATNSDDDTMTSFSSWGPTNDGRLKPDVSAPGCENTGEGFIKSTLPGDTYGGSGWCGTSMAAPAVSGIIALMLEEFDNQATGPLPSTVKAILVHTAEDLGSVGPDYVFGYGRVDAVNAIDVIQNNFGTNSTIAQGNITGTGDSDVYLVNIPAGQSEFKITLVWDDVPATPNAAPALVNNLDLVVTDPTSTRHFPWVLNPASPASPATNGVDTLNNIEQVLANPPGGTWTVTVNGTAVPSGPQSYSLVYTTQKFPTLLSTLIEPTVNITVAQNDFFTFNSSVQCVGGTCSNVVGILDPETELAYDDGSLEAFLRFSRTSGGGLAVRFTPDRYSVEIKTARFFVDTTRTFELHVWDDDGPGGGPGTDLITPFATSPTADAWNDFDLSSFGVTINSGDFFIGWIETWTTGGNPATRRNALGSDTTPPVTGRSWAFDRTDWRLLSTFGSPFDTYDLMVRAVVTDPGKGVIPEDAGIPFYTTSSNPWVCGTLLDGESCTTAWSVNATGGLNETYDFFATYASANVNIPINQTEKLGITIGEEFSGTLISITLTGFPVDFGNLDPDTANSSATGNVNDSYVVSVDPVTNVNVDIFQRGDDFVTIDSTLAVANVTIDDDNVLQGAGDTGSPELILNSTFGTTPYFSNVTPNSSENVYYWLTVPPLQRAGDYNTTFYFTAVETETLP